jgi:hypothetical protein
MKAPSRGKSWRCSLRPVALKLAVERLAYGDAGIAQTAVFGGSCALVFNFVPVTVGLNRLPSGFRGGLLGSRRILSPKNIRLGRFVRMRALPPKLFR